MAQLVIVLIVLGLVAFVAIRSTWRVERESDLLRDERRANESRERDLRPRPPIQ